MFLCQKKREPGCVIRIFRIIRRLFFLVKLSQIL